MSMCLSSVCIKYTHTHTQHTHICIHICLYMQVKAMQRVYELREMFLRAEGLIQTGDDLNPTC